MADRFPKLLFISFMLILTFILCSPPPRAQSEDKAVAAAANVTANATDQLAEEVPAEMRCLYLGKWKTDASSLFHRLVSSSGRCYFTCVPKSDLFDCRLVLFDGDWEDDSLFYLDFHGLGFNYTRRDISLENQTVWAFAQQHVNFANFQMEGNVSYAGDDGERLSTASLWGVQEDFLIETDLKQLTEDDYKRPKKLYCGIVSLLSILIVVAVKRQERALAESSQTAAKV